MLNKHPYHFKGGYNVENVELQHDESLVKVNKRTGEVTTVTKGSKPKTGYSKFQPNGSSFKKYFERSWDLLERKTTKNEFVLAHKLALRAQPFTNILPYDSETSYRLLAEELDDNKNTVKERIDKLHSLGVLGKIEVYGSDGEIISFWIFNPFLAFNGKLIKDEIVDLFKHTVFAKIYTTDEKESLYS